MKPILVAAAMLISTTSFAGEVDVTAVDATKTGDETYRFSVTLSHSDTGWDHYADKWEVVAPDGTVLETRVLAHPHVEEQPFTRSKSGIKIPHTIKSVKVRGHDSVHGFGGKEMTVKVN